MKLLAYASIKLTLLLILGILIGYTFQIPIKYCFGFLLCCFAILGYFFIRKADKTLKFKLVAGITVIFIGMFSFLQSQSIQYDHYFKKVQKTEFPLLQVKITDVLKPNAFSQNYVAEVLMADGKKTIGKILINQSTDSIHNTFQVDDELFIKSKISPINPPLNPHQFNFKEYMGHLGVHHSLKLSLENFTVLPNPSKTLIGYAQQVRSNIIKKLENEDFGREQLSIIRALLLGERTTISEDTYSNYVDAGAVHILAVSGLHVGILLMLIQFVLRPLNRLPYGKKIVLFLTLILLWAFAFIAGLSPSIIRACAMFTFVAYAMYMNRPSNSFNILALSMFFILLVINPNLLFQVGFQMSYAAVFAIVWIYPLLQKWWFPKNRIIRYLWQLLSVSIAAQLGVLPISLFYFHQFPGLFFISNLLIVPFLGLILGMGMIIIVLSLVEKSSSSLIWMYNEVIGLMNKIVSWVANQETFLFKSISFDEMQLTLGYLVIGSLVFAFSKTNYRRIMLFLGFLLMFQTYTIYKEFEAGSKSETIILHQVKNSVLFDKNGNMLKVLTVDSTRLKRLVDNYIVQERIDQTRYLPVKNSYLIYDKSLQIIDSAGVYLPTNTNTIFLLTKSPKINRNVLFKKLILKKLLRMAATTLVLSQTGNKLVYNIKSHFIIQVKWDFTD
ncbi:ComEC family competence protein [Maribacter litopenaei]|uniref:ComEC family competence protein n=1 Tax=Maribacter litopenaei TaxID=2976127 RepID=A0ABY5Y6A2_9FLAO|nr:ComEC/Rec2 family competence protein [Maribacter litopenaei]UWX54562.1 ComEC family competence protein [Maribacter litopenaei]